LEFAEGCPDCCGQGQTERTHSGEVWIDMTAMRGSSSYAAVRAARAMRTAALLYRARIREVKAIRHRHTAQPVARLRPVMTPWPQLAWPHSIPAGRRGAASSRARSVTPTPPDASSADPGGAIARMLPLVHRALPHVIAQVQLD